MRMLRAATLLGLLAAPVGAADAPLPPVLAGLRGETDRLYAKLSALPDTPVYYLGASVTETRSVRIVGAWGGITEDARRDDRLLDLDLRVGAPALDNTHHAAGEGGPGLSISLQDDPGAIAADLWLETERRYRDAKERLSRVVADHAVKVAEEDPSPDFAAAPREISIEPPVSVTVDAEAWSGLARRVSAEFRKYPDVLESSVQLSGLSAAKYFVNSEGTTLAQSLPRVEARITASARADDGMEFSLYRNFMGRAAADLPDAAGLTAAVDEIGATLAGLKKAPLVDPFVGPAILSGRAAAVLFHEVLGHRLEGHRQKDESADQTFTKKMGQRILPTFITIVSDPTQAAIRGTMLAGHYRFDDEGVRARPVTLVDRGVLKAFMMCRSPVRGFPASNGHGRKQAGKGAVARQSNLLVQATRTVPAASLRGRLIALCREKHQPYGLIFEDIEGGFTFTQRTTPNAFNVMPIVVRRVYADGRPDELVRGVDLIGTPLSTLARIAAAGDDLGVFNGFCGAESGYVPVAAASPSLLISEVEVQRKEKGRERPPLMPSPEGTAP